MRECSQGSSAALKAQLEGHWTTSAASACPPRSLRGPGAQTFIFVLHSFCTTLVPADPELIRQVAVKHFAKFHDRPSLVSFPSGWVGPCVAASVAGRVAGRVTTSVAGLVAARASSRVAASVEGGGHTALQAAQPQRGCPAGMAGERQASPVVQLYSCPCSSLTSAMSRARPCLPQQEQAAGGAAFRPAGQPGRLLVRSAQTAECAGCPAQASLHAVGNRSLTCQHPAPFNATHRPPGKTPLAGAPCAPRLTRCSTQRPWPATRPCSTTVVRAGEQSRRLLDYHAVCCAPNLAHSALPSFVEHASMVPVQQTGWPLAGLAKRAWSVAARRGPTPRRLLLVTCLPCCAHASGPVLSWPSL